MAVHTPDQLRELLVTLLSGATGKDAAHWRAALGPVEHLPLSTNVRSNWQVTPKGSKADRAAMERAAELVREQHPYVARRSPAASAASAAPPRGRAPRTAQ